MKTKSGFFGVYPMVYALFDDKGNLAREPMRRQIQSMLKHKVHGIGVLGLASEVNKLSTAERRQLMEWVAEDIGGKVPLTVTVAETSVGGQIEFVKAAAAVGAKWAILQPPLVSIGLSNAGVRALHRAHPNFSIIKLEATAISIANLLNDVEGELDVFNGRDGIEMLDSMRAGAVGIIPGGEAFDVLARAFDHMASGTEAGIAEAERLYAKVLPLLILLMESMDTFLVYGKPVLGHRLGSAETKPRLPSTPPTAFGLAMAKRYAEMLGKL